MTRITENHTPAMLLSHEDADHILSDGSLLRFTLRPVYLVGGNVHNYLDDHGDQPLADLVITAQHDSHTYGWEVRYTNLYSVDLARAEAMVKTLRKLKRGLERLEAKYGYAETFGAYVVRVADVLDVETFGWRRTGSGVRFSDNEYHWTGNTGLQSQINQVVYEFDRAHPRTATSVGD